jgi:serine protease AprX
MSRTVKVFCAPRDQERLAESYGAIEHYDGFVLLEVTDAEAEAIARLYPCEDITDQYTIEVDDGEIDTDRPRVDARGKQQVHPAYGGAKRLSPGPHHYLVQFVGPIKETWLEQVAQAGGEPRAPFGGFTYVVCAERQALGAVAALPFVRWVGHLRHEHRIARSLAAKIEGGDAADLARTRKLADTYTVEFFDARDMRDGIARAKSLGFRVLSQSRKAGTAVLQNPAGEAAAAKRLRGLSAVHGVRSIRELALKRTSNDVAAAVMGTQASSAVSSLGLAGGGEVIGICDTGLDTGNPGNVHPDFAGRIDAFLSYPITADYNSFVTNRRGDDGPADLDSGHGTHVAGSVLGDGSASAGLAGTARPIRGLAHRARLVFQAVEQEMKWRDPNDLRRYGRYLLTGIPNDLGTLFADAYQRGVRVHSNSWGGGDAGAYDVQCEQLDRFVWEHKDFCVIVANGNDGTDDDGDGRINSGSVTSPATSKNCISVGASENLRPGFNGNTYGGWWPSDYPASPFAGDPMANDPEQVAAFSSRGPTSDGRIKPDVVAPGTFVLSTRSTMIAPNNMAWAAFPPSRLYFYMGGTSMATPLTAGAIALIREYLRTRRQVANPSAALLKASVIAGAVRLPAATLAVADNDQGFGRVNLDAVLAPPSPVTAEFIDGMSGLLTGQVFSKTLPIASAQAPLKAVLVYSDFPGESLVNNLNLILQAPDGKRFVGNQLPGAMTADAKNNVELVRVESPVAGEWAIQVVASNVPHGPQDFALVLLGHFGAAPTAGDIVEAEASPKLAIPDNVPQGVTSTLRIDRPGKVVGIRVQVDIRHTFIGDLRIWLTPPNQQQISLHTRSGGGTDDLHRTYDVSTTPALADALGSAAAGDWRLTVADQAALDIGVLDHWKLSLTCGDSDPFRAESEPAVAIPDNDPAGVSDTVVIRGQGVLRDIDVSLDITHTWIGDLRVTLVAPSGKSAVLHDRAGASADNIVKTFSVATSPALAALVGETTAGSWRLLVVDLAGRDVGKLNRWSLRITA